MVAGKIPSRVHAVMPGPKGVDALTGVQEPHLVWSPMIQLLVPDA